MRLKELNGIAASIAHKFASSAEHFAYLATLHECSEVEIDLRTQTITPALFDIERNRNLVQCCADNLWRLVQPESLVKASLMARFDGEVQAGFINNSTTEVRLTSVAGQEAAGSHSNKPQLICA